MDRKACRGLGSAHPSPRGGIQAVGCIKLGVPASIQENGSRSPRSHPKSNQVCDTSTQLASHAHFPACQGEEQCCGKRPGIIAEVVQGGSSARDLPDQLLGKAAQ